MDPDFTALASRVAARAEVLGCIILSRDGLVLGAFPPHGEHDITPGLLRFAALGDPDRGFAEFSDELWAYVRQGSYAAFAVAEHGVRPGILLDYLEQALLVAEEARQFGQAMTEPVHVDLSQKGVSIGRRLRAATSESEAEFRSAVTRPVREGRGEERHDVGHGAAGGGPVPVVPAVDDGALDEALAAAVAAGGSAAGRDEPDASPAALEVATLEGGIPPELVVEEPARHAADGDWEDDGRPAASAPDDGHQSPGSGYEDAPEPRFVPAPAKFGESPEAAEEAPGRGHPGPGRDWEADPDPSRLDEQEPTHEEPQPPAPANPDEIDRVALAREFAQLLQEGPPAAD